MIKLSVSNKGYALIKDGLPLLSCASHPSKTKRVALLKNVAKGLIASKGNLTVEDLLVIELSDNSAYTWLVENRPHKAHMTTLPDIYFALQALPCRYRFAYTPKPTVDTLDLGRKVLAVTDFSM